MMFQVDWYLHQAFTINIKTCLTNFNEKFSFIWFCTDALIYYLLGLMHRNVDF